MGIKHETDRTQEEKPKVSDLRTFVPSYFLFFVLCFAYLWLVVEPRLIYHCFGTILPDAPQFAAGWSFLRQSLTLPGGFVTYVSGFLSLGFHHSWLGAGIIVLAGVCLAELTRRHLAKAGFARASVPAAFPAIALFLIYSHYKHPLPMSLAASSGLLLSLLFEQRPLHRPLARIAVFCLMAAVGFWLAGAGALLVFAVMTTIHAIFLRRDWTTAVLALPAGVAIVWVLAQCLFLIPVRQAFLILTPFAQPPTAGMNTFSRALTFLLYGLAPSILLLAILGRRVFDRQGRKPTAHLKKTRGKQKHAATERKRPSLAALAKPVLAALPVALMALGLYFSHDDLRKPYVLSNYHWRQRQWDKILDVAQHLPRNKTNIFVNHDILRALYHTGRLPYDMFRFPLVPEAILLTHEKGESDLTQLKLSDLFLELGHVNMAQKLASELVSTKGHPGVAIEKLGWISIIKGQPATARVYLEALKKAPLYRKTAESLLHGLDGGFAPEQSAYIDRIRSCLRDETAGVTGAEPVDQWLAGLIEHNPRNRMAFEYLMACYLLTGRVDKIAENVPRLRDLGYEKIPTLYEEAILVHCEAQLQKVNLAGFTISQETLKRYESFVQIAGGMQSQNRQIAFNRLIREFGASYFFYCSFGRVGQG